QSPQREEQEEEVSVFISTEPVAMNNKLPAWGGEPFSLPRLRAMKKRLLSSPRLGASSKSSKRARDNNFLCLGPNIRSFWL
ncbi:hypothetical protein, partial [Desulfonatronospira sp.]|uniref:hypothetical protein n=1 Tax=Desulfonatronospira sp. TaxID=1962951 RepID=UPI0025BF714C